MQDVEAQREVDGRLEQRIDENQELSSRVREREEEKKRKVAQGRANEIIDALLPRSREQGLFGLLPVVARRYPPFVLVCLIERIEAEQWDLLSGEDKMEVEKIKTSLGL